MYPRKMVGYIFKILENYLVDVFQISLYLMLWINDFLQLNRSKCFKV